MARRTMNNLGDWVVSLDIDGMVNHIGCPDPKNERKRALIRTPAGHMFRECYYCGTPLPQAIIDAVLLVASGGRSCPL